jgi:hypothetical protein
MVIPRKCQSSAIQAPHPKCHDIRAQYLSAEQLNLLHRRTEIEKNSTLSNQRTVGPQYQAPPARLSRMNEREIADDFERVLGECQSQRQQLQGLMNERRLLIQDRSNLETEFRNFVARLLDDLRSI